MKKLDLDINHALINEYKPEQGIMAHTDGPTYQPIVCTITTGGGQILNFVDNQRKLKHKMYLEPRKIFDSLLFTNFLLYR